MKWIALISLVLSVGFLACRDFGVEPQPETEYYWAEGQKVYVLLDRTTVVAVYNSSPSAPGLRLDTLRFATSQFGPLRSILQSRGVDPDSLEWISFGYTYQGFPFIPTNRIVFAPKPGVALDSLAPLIVNEAVFESTTYGATTIKLSKQDGNVFRLANRIYESGLVLYSSPDFLGWYTLWKMGAA